MKLNYIRHWLGIGCAVALLVSAVNSLQAGGPKSPPHVGANQPVTLTAVQQQALKDAHSAIVTNSQALLTQLKTAVETLDDAVTADAPSEDAIRAAAKAIGDIEGGLAVIRATELAKIRSLFSVDEWAKLKALGMFDRWLYLDLRAFNYPHLLWPEGRFSALNDF